MTRTSRLSARRPRSFSRRLALELLESRQLLAVLTLTEADWLTEVKRDPLFAKVGQDLTRLHAEHAQVGENLQSSDRLFFDIPGALSPDLQFRGPSAELVVIDAIATENAAELQRDLEQLGLQHGEYFGRVVSGYLPIDAIDGMAELSSLAFARPAYAPITNVGLVDSQGDVAQRSDVARATFGVNGAGQTVGVLSDTFDNTVQPEETNAADDVVNGDLPGPGNPNGFTTPVNVLSEGPAGTDEGRAMLQLVHDVAPAAHLAFHTASHGEADFANGILELRQVAGATVIVDDVVFLSEPMFQDGIAAQAADQVVAAGVPYFSSAQNQARQSYQSDYRPSGISDAYGEYHDFDPGPGVDIFQSFTLDVGQAFKMSFQWDAPFASAGGSGCSSDMDIFVTDASGNILVSGVENNVNGDALEMLFFVNDGSLFTNQFNFVITHYGGPRPNLVKSIDFSSARQLNEYATHSATSFGHANAAGAESVAAAFYQHTPAYGVDPPQPEHFTSLGGIPTLFDVNGDSMYELRAKPEITGPDGGNTTFFHERDPENDGFENFYGTSAAAPHVAAVAALMLELDGSLTPTDIYTALEQTAIDMDDPFTPGFDTGFDNLTGFGLIQADAALHAIGGGGIEPIDLGTLPPGTTTPPGETLGQQEIIFYQFELSSGVAAADGDYLVIDTLGSSLTDAGFGPDDTEIGLYDASGNLIAENDDAFVDRRESRLAFGDDPAGQTAGDLSAAVYFLALGGYDTEFMPTNFDVMSDSTATGTAVVNFELSAGAVVDGDFNRDGQWDHDDIDALTRAIAGGSTDLAFDMNGDRVITRADIVDAGLGWLAVGGARNPAATGGNAFLEGDANLDGAVDVSDFNSWNSHKFTSTDEWSKGDFNASGAVDVSDFNVWNNNKFRNSNSPLLVSVLPVGSGHSVMVTVPAGESSDLTADLASQQEPTRSSAAVLEGRRLAPTARHVDAVWACFARDRTVDASERFADEFAHADLLALSW